MMHSDNDIKSPGNLPLVSVVIPCYNQGHFLEEAIQSAKNQTYSNIEIIIVNDGSTDNTSTMLKSLNGIKYVEQANLGLPNARNRGTTESNGKYVIFLDADDLLYPDAVEKNIYRLMQDPSLAFVSGRYTRINEMGEEWHSRYHQINKDHYVEMLQTNYIGNPAAVLYTRWILDIYPFDNSIKIKGCEDYDHYLKITRMYTVAHHHEFISIYRKHEHNMSDNYVMMLESALHTLNRQIPFLQNEKELMAFQTGIIEWKGMYLNWIYDLVISFNLKKIPALEKKFFWKFKFDMLRIFWIKMKIKTRAILIKSDNASNHDLSR
jgi:glycosyltransferase involved in cell wall biosynthesis